MSTHGQSHVHDWTHDPAIGWACTTCPDTSETCQTCQDRPTGGELLICPRCLDHERRVLDDIEAALDHWQPTPTSVIKAVRYDRDRINGTPGDDDDPTRITVPLDVFEVLGSWAQAWAEAVNWRLGAVDLIPWLRDHLLWAAQNPHASGWDDYRREARQMRHHARRIAGLLPKHHPAPCIHCGGSIVQDAADPDWNPLPDGISDTLRCTGCQMTWADRDRVTALAVQVARSMDPNPDALVSERQARTILRVGTSTIRQWVKRDQLVRQGRRNGVAVYRLGDIQRLAAPSVVDAAG